MKKYYILPLAVCAVLTVLTAAACGKDSPSAQEIIYTTGADNTGSTAAFYDRISFTDIPSGSDGMSFETGVYVPAAPDEDGQTDEAPGAAVITTAAATREVVLTTTAAPVLTSPPTTASRADGPQTVDAVFLGVNNYGAASTNRDNMNNLDYRFSVGGTQTLYKINNGNLISDGVYDYPIQNILKEGSRYSLTVTGGTITAATEIITDELYYNPVVSGTPGLRTVRNFLRTAMEPVGTTLYVFGGGWDWQDTGSSVQSRTIGVSPDWVRFFGSHDANYTYRDRDGDSANKDPANSYYPYGGFNEYYYAGLDCSGYVGWAVYNTLNTQSGGEGYVTYATKQAKYFASSGLGEFSRSVSVPDGGSGTASRPGDIMSINGHIWISLGTCADGSVVMLHSTPSYSRAGQPGGGVQMGAIGSSESCGAYKLADYYMSVYYPEWYARYPVSLKSPKTYFSVSAGDAGRFRWGTDTLSDPEGIRDMSAEDALYSIFSA